jgi:hypothetical protein
VISQEQSTDTKRSLPGHQTKPRSRSVIDARPSARCREASLRSHKNVAPGRPARGHVRRRGPSPPSTRLPVSPLGQLGMRGQHISRQDERARFRGVSQRWRRGPAGLPWASLRPYGALVAACELEASGKRPRTTAGATRGGEVSQSSGPRAASAEASRAIEGRSRHFGGEKPAARKKKK